MHHNVLGVNVETVGSVDDAEHQEEDTEPLHDVTDNYNDITSNTEPGPESHSCSWSISYKE